MCTLYLAQMAFGGHMGVGGGVKDIQILSEPQNGCPAVTARCSDHKWTSHKQENVTNEFSAKLATETLL